MKGTIDFFHDRKGYGFIETEDADEDVFFRLDTIDNIFVVEEGMEVSFEKEETPMGPEVTEINHIYSCNFCGQGKLYNSKKGEWFCPWCDNEY